MPSPDYRPYFYVQGKRVDSDGNWLPVPLNEHHTVLNGLVRIKEIPYLTATDRVTIVGMTEVWTVPPTPNTFQVHYPTGRIKFHSGNENQEVNISYKGTGSLVATDEINYLYDQSVRQNSFVGLNDTADYLVPRAYLRVDKEGKIIYSDAATVGRATSVATIQDFAANPVYVFDGTPFDIIALYANVPPVVEIRPYTLSVIEMAGGTVTSGVWDSGAGPSKITIGPLDTSAITNLNVISDTYVSKGTGLRFVILADAKYYRLEATGIVYIGTAPPADILVSGNDIDELANLTSLDLAFLQGSSVNFVFAGSGNAQLNTTWNINAAFGGGWKQVQFDSEYDLATRQWHVTAPTAESYLVTVGSGHDDLTCTADVFKFESVNPNETVAVYSPAQTIINVLYEADNTAAVTTTWPVTWESSLPAEQFIRIPGSAYTSTSPEITALDVNPVPLTIVSARQWPPRNSLVGGYNVTYTGPLALAPGRTSPSMIFRRDTITSDITKMYLRNYAHTGGDGDAAGKSGYYPIAIGGWFHFLYGRPVILSSSNPEANANLQRVMYLRFIAETTLRVYLLKSDRGPTYTEEIFDLPVPTGWLWICIERLEVTGTLDFYLNMRLRINDQIHKLAGYLNRAHNGEPLKVMPVPNAIGNCIPAQTAQASIGSFLCESPVAYDRYLTNQQGLDLYNTMQAKWPPITPTQYTKFAAPQTFFEAGITSFDVEYNPAANPQAISGNYCTRYFLMLGTTRYFTLDFYNNLVELAAPSDELLWLRGMTYERITALFNNNYEATKNMKLYAINSASTGFSPGMSREFQVYDVSASMLKLARPGVDVEIIYNDTTKSWMVKSLLPDTATIHLAVLGSATHTSVCPVKLSDLIDGIGLDDVPAKTLVSYRGRMDKRIWMHPYLLRG